MFKILKKLFEITTLSLFSVIALLLGMMSGSWAKQGSLNFAVIEKPNPLYACGFCQSSNTSKKEEIASSIEVFFNSFKNLWEAPLNTAPAFASNKALAKDSDQDGLTDRMELFLGTDIANPDTDRDGYPDGTELKNGYSPLISSVSVYKPAEKLYAD